MEGRSRQLIQIGSWIRLLFDDIGCWITIRRLDVFISLPKSFGFLRKTAWPSLDLRTRAQKMSSNQFAEKSRNLLRSLHDAAALNPVVCSLPLWITRRSNWFQWCKVISDERQQFAFTCRGGSKSHIQADSFGLRKSICIDFSIRFTWKVHHSEKAIAGPLDKGLNKYLDLVPAGSL